MFVGKLPERLQHQHLEHQDDFIRLATSVALVLFLMDDLEKRAEAFPVDDPVQPGQWITRLLKLYESRFMVEKAWLGRHVSDRGDGAIVPGMGRFLEVP